jgi:hypothetical protein
MDANGQSNLPAKNGDQSMKKRLFHKSMGTTAGLRKLLPAGTTLAFETMAPSFTKGGQCSDHDVNFVFTWALIGFLTFLCAALRFTDSITDKDGNTHYGVATLRGFKLFNCKREDLQLSDEEWENLKRRMKWKRRDFLHALFGAAVFGVLAFGDAGVQRCLVPWESRHWKDLLAHLPLAVGFLASFVFMIWPSTRNGIGEAGDALGDTEDNNSQKEHMTTKVLEFDRISPNFGEIRLFR